MAKGPGQGWEESDSQSPGGLSSPHLCKVFPGGLSREPGRPGSRGASFFLPLLLPLSPPAPGFQNLHAPCLCSWGTEGQWAGQRGSGRDITGSRHLQPLQPGPPPRVSSAFPPCAPGSLAPASRRHPQALGGRGCLRVGLGLGAWQGEGGPRDPALPHLLPTPTPTHRKWGPAHPVTSPRATPVRQLVLRSSPTGQSLVWLPA